ncbi:MAG: 3-oxoacyl-ACP reductase [Acidobacteria bacterium]|nr:MAG: 3-oxoacyl-ACP reductase [Acidobacteriota bacterium]
MPTRWLGGKSVVITGAGRGIGRAAAELFAAEGARLLVSDLDGEALEDTVAQIRTRGGEALALEGSVTDREFDGRLAKRAEASFGALDALVNNAGFTWDGTLHKMTDEQWQAMLDVHLTAPFRLIRALAPLMRGAAKVELAETGFARPRKIVNVSSTSATRGNFGQTNYAAAKAGIIGLTRTLAREWGPFNIQVNCAAFGLIDTRLTQAKEGGEKFELRADHPKGSPAQEPAAIELGIPSAIREAALKLIPMGRPGTPGEAAGVILFLASPLSDYVSGQVVEVTGGA